MALERAPSRVRESSRRYSDHVTANEPCTAGVAMLRPVLTVADNSESSEGSKNALLIQSTTFSVKPEEGNFYLFQANGLLEQQSIYEFQIRTRLP
jgi:hypothetical protein